MADLSDVSNMLVGQIAAYLYPNGTNNPNSPVVGFPVKVFSGWPQPEALTQDLAAGTGFVSVYPLPSEKILLSTDRDWKLLSAPTATIVATVAGQSITLTGAVQAGQNLAAIVDGKPYVVALQETDSLAAVAAALAMLISADQPATSDGTTLTIPGAHDIVARAGTVGRMIRELRRQRKTYQISVWANCYNERDQLGMAVDQALMPLLRADLPDGSVAIFHYQSSRQDDSQQKQRIYRRDLFYAIDYSTTQNADGTSVVVPLVTVVGGIDVSLSTTP